MKFLFVFYVPTGGMDAVNRHRCRALKQFGHEPHCLYLYPGSGQQNVTDIPTFVTNDDRDIKTILTTYKYDAIVVTTMYETFPRFRGLGYKGILIWEIQGYGPITMARAEIINSVPYVKKYCSAILYPDTPHIGTLLNEIYMNMNVPFFSFNNAFDVSSFCYKPLPQWGVPIIAWVGRFEDNKNWRELLLIAHQLMAYYPHLHLWMFEDPNLAVPQERAEFDLLVQQLGLLHCLTIHSNIPHALMQEYYSIIGDSGGFLCSTSKMEGAPHSVVEAMSCLCPVLTSDKDGVWSAIIPNQTGKMYPLGNITAAVIEGQQLISNPYAREYIRTNAKIHVSMAFSLERYACHFMQMMNVLYGK
ncbi:MULTISPECIES: glycosyltransferase family 4 protein [unclassified Paenibacillus]|uniref:glycosyltransferase family 4 protein n=1 Tax=unclassified Paenibacillus TaxID=185978 RepID=UPI000710EC8E|nr:MULTISPECIES: glycosyltransferase [unclassified Paenibacillus]KQX49169.1 glycosyl transferase family 1 [Paenibacillus sp. Root444D2]KRE48655.1 glycosyl transferase family 1 [Paenibacillus sp. Soil724D2]